MKTQRGDDKKEEEGVFFWGGVRARVNSSLAGRETRGESLGEGDGGGGDGS